MDIIQILTLIGIPTVLGTLIIYVVKRLHDSAKKIRAIELGVQAVLRAQMIDSYSKYSDKGYAPLYARDNFENLWTQYHALGANGVMNDTHDKFMALPVTPQANEGDGHGTGAESV